MSLNDDIDSLIDPILAVFRDNFQARLQGYAVSAFLRGSAQVTSWGRTQKGLEKLFEGPPMQEAINYARKHCAQLVTNMDDETKARLADLIRKAIEDKSGIPGLAKQIRTEFADMTLSRSRLIATTETRDALFHASQDRMEKMGVTGKGWVLGSGGREGNCEFCRQNAAVGIIPIEDEFPTPQYEIHPG